MRLKEHVSRNEGTHEDKEALQIKVEKWIEPSKNKMAGLGKGWYERERTKRCKQVEGAS